MTGNKAFALVAIALIAAVGGVIPTQLSTSVSVNHLEIDGLSLDVPESIPANEGFDIVISGAQAGETIAVTVDASYGQRHFSGIAEQGAATTIPIPPLTQPGSGVAVITAQSETKVGWTTLEFVPGSAVDPLDLYLGPRTVVANEEDFSMIVAVPKDELGNPVANGTPVSYLVTRPSTESETLRHQTEGLLSFVTVLSSTEAGRTRLAVQVDEATGPERSFIEVAGVPERFEIESVDPLPPADGHALFRLRTSRLTDRHGNELPDGTNVVLTAEGATGFRQLESITIDAVAEFVVEAPSQPGEATVVASASGTRSEPLTLVFDTAVAELPVRVGDHEDGLLVSIGPITTTRQSFVPDGTVATIKAGESYLEVPTDLGRAEIVIPKTQDTVTVEVLGTSVIQRRSE